ncbi:pep [Trichoplusia ni granulovirus LBIV-12]|jgi:archaellum component FlaC|uniref:Pep n=2 Tax=Betabaculovirus TaxID=558017 RepID=A0A1D8QL45_GVTN|nr:polyhedral envelope protein/P10 fusion [Pseudalatia unipuncta granulovirus]YP_009506087.1 pep [Trichoplusia ni granulovirus LBIV-12]ACH69368.1 polyhedral envelope protein/P10 fusion [Pseudalatia unipuncta granulovirus]AOW41356.1 pep [Trichoplusia ni granulovirus LBIV-12]
MTSRLIFSTRVDGTDVPVFFSGVATDKPYVGVKELLNILGHSMTHADEFPRSETKLWQDLAPGDVTFPPNKLFTTEVGFAVYFGKTKLTNWARFKRMFDLIAQYIADPTPCNATNPLCMIPPGRQSGCGPCPLPGPGNNCDVLSQLLQILQNQGAVLQAILADVQQILANGGGGGGCDLTGVLADLQTLLTQVAALTTTVNTIAGQINTISTDVGGLVTAVANLSTQIDNINTSLVNLTVSVNALTNSVDIINTRLDTLETNVGSLLASVANLVNSIAGLVTDVGNIANGLAALEATVAANTNTLNILNANVQLILDILQPPINVTSSSSGGEDKEGVSALPDDQKKALVNDIYKRLGSLDTEVKRLNNFNDGFNKVLKNSQIKVKG